MKIYIITTETFPYGLAATQRIKCYAKSIASLGYNCTVLCVNRCEDSNNPLGNNDIKGEIDGYRFSYLGRSTFLKGPIRNRLNQLYDMMSLVIKILCSFTKNDCVILYSYNPFLFKLVSRLSIIKGYKFLYELNEHPSIHRRLYGIEGESQKDLQKIRRRLNNVDGILCISNALKALLLKAGIAENRIHIVNMLVDSSRFYGIEKENVKPYIGYCGAADNNKDGVDRLIEAFSKIASAYPDLKLYIMGPKNTVCKNELLTKNLGMEERVIFTGMINPDDMPQMLVNATVLALARPESIQAKYGFPTKLGEYLLTANPVVVTAVGDIPIFLKDGVSAYLAEPDNLDIFAEKLNNALSDNNSKEIGMKGRKVAEDCFSSVMVRSQLSKALGI